MTAKILGSNIQSPLELPALAGGGHLSGKPAMRFDLARARADTPGVANVVHFNNAGASLPPKPVFDAVSEHLERERDDRRLRGGEREAGGRSSAPTTRSPRSSAARPDEIAIVENATRAWDMAFYGLPLAPGDRILTARAEYASNYIAFLQVATRPAPSIEVVAERRRRADRLSTPCAAADRRAVAVKLVAITHVPTQGGLVNPAEEIGADRPGGRVPYLLDACQSVGQMPFDVEQIGCDMLSAHRTEVPARAAGHRLPLRAQRALVDLLEPPFLDLHAATWTAPDAIESAPTPAASRTGKPTTPPRSASASPWTTPCVGHGRHAARVAASPRTCGTSSRRRRSAHPRPRRDAAAS